MRKIKTLIFLICLNFGYANAQWGLIGNAATNPLTNFIGTTDAKDLVIKTNNTEVLRFSSTGKLTVNALNEMDGANFSGNNYYGQWLAVNSNSANPTTGAGYRMNVNGTVKSQIFFNQNYFSYGTVMDGLVGNTEILSKAGDVYLSTNNYLTNSLILKNTTGYVGIGTTNPTTRLEVNSKTAGVSGLKFTQLTSSSTPSTANNKSLSLDASGNVILVPAAAADGSTTKVNAGTYTTVTGLGTAASPYVIGVNGPWVASPIGVGNVSNSNPGSIIIGTGFTTTTQVPSGYKLYVSGGILTEKIKAALQTSANWADYVFDKNYNLQSLTEVEKFIIKNKHLPGVPSAEELVKDGGIDMNQMFAKQMEKIEELTLYIIEQNKKIEALEKKVENNK